jgi:secondary thiamine-phosphate synthase enzyme
MRAEHSERIMSTYTDRIHISTKGDSDVVDINEQVLRVVRDSRFQNGLVCAFVVGSTAAITTTEAEPGLLTHDLAAFYEKLAPADAYYKHEATWNDDNGHAHVRASSLGPSVTVPLVDGRLTLGTWQQIVLLDFDTRPRKRQIVVQILGE